MDQSIISKASLARMRVKATVDQHPLRAKGRSTSLALATALASCADEVCGKLSLNELCMVASHRMMDIDAMATVDRDTLFTMFIAIDDELQRRKDESEPPMMQLVEDVPPITPFASCVGVDDADHDELEAYAVRMIHAECMDTEEYLN